MPEITYFFVISKPNNSLKVKRTFIAIPIHPNHHLFTIIQQIKMDLRDEKIRWVPMKNLHLTLVFLGNTTSEGEKKVQRIVKKTTHQMDSFTIKISGLSTFPSIKKPRILWAGIEDPQALINLQIKLHKNLRTTLNWYNKEEKFIPHLTLARMKYVTEPDKFSERMEKYRKEFNQEVIVSEVVHYESILKPQGPVYHALSRFPLLELVS